MNEQLLESIRRAERALLRDCAAVSRLCTPREPASVRLEEELGQGQAARLVRALSGSAGSMRLAA
jgi:uncharacterized membrane protein YccC